MLPVEVTDLKHIVSFILLFIFLFPGDKSLSICKILRKREETQGFSGCYQHPYCVTWCECSWKTAICWLPLGDCKDLYLIHKEKEWGCHVFFKRYALNQKKEKDQKKKKLFHCLCFEPFIFETLKSFWLQRDTFLFESYEYLLVRHRLATLVADISPSQPHKQH